MNDATVSQKQVEEIIKALKGLEYGSVLITVHDTNIVQIDRTEKHRFPLASTESKRIKGRQK
ncbi:hypothetical protein GCM10007416_00890 [Kroppenstedtia guangzhouensis]|jgi:hypothetical protein|uniref:DUF2292 domain-containing protein n=1 Tax=Kroppenstedtia guangzhouensis TaxID=1274356 RepID=A0ABQ1FY79_9BACL|nr:YezD family protein [Kroppenstedtia guangzhouensis]GGA32135.1 hypothetical protein GCM10007416_00890 [Kroppenstedtia guangzhouensis]